MEGTVLNACGHTDPEVAVLVPGLPANPATDTRNPRECVLCLQGQERRPQACQALGGCPEVSPCGDRCWPWLKPVRAREEEGSGSCGWEQGGVTGGCWARPGVRPGAGPGPNGLTSGSFASPPAK